jgi:hypothetical protein
MTSKEWARLMFELTDEDAPLSGEFIVSDPEIERKQRESLLKQFAAAWKAGDFKRVTSLREKIRAEQKRQDVDWKLSPLEKNVVRARLLLEVEFGRVPTLPEICRRLPREHQRSIQRVLDRLGIACNKGKPGRPPK